MSNKMKVVINSCHGGFGLSESAVLRYAELKGITLYTKKSSYGSNLYYTDEKLSDMFLDCSVPRDDPQLVQVVEELGIKANGFCSSLKIVKIPDDIKWHIEEYDGAEWVAEDHRTWS